MTGYLSFQAISWYINDGTFQETDKEHLECSIYVIGRTETGERVCLKITGFQPRFLVHINDAASEGDYVSMERYVNNFVGYMDPATDKWTKVPHVVDSGTVSAATIWGFTNGEQLLCKELRFSSLWAYKLALAKFKNKVDDVKKRINDKNYRIYNVIDPLLQFLHERDIQPASWICVPMSRLDEPPSRDTNCDLEYTIHCDFVDSEDQNKVCGRFRQMAFDIEVDSYDEAFPEPDDPRNPAFQIGITVKEYNGDIKRVILHYGPGCSAVADTEIRVYPTEKELLFAFRDYINTEKPDAIYHYNGDVFDWSYLYKRAEVLGISKEFGKMSPFRDFVCSIKEESFSSSARGDNDYKRVELPGILNVDVLIYLKQDTTNPMDSYKLDNVAELLLGDKKKPVSAKELFRYYKSGDPDKAAIIADYCIQDTLLVQRLVDKLQIVNALVAMANICYVQITDLITRGQQIKMYSQLFKYAAKMGYIIPWFRQGFDPRLCSVQTKPDEYVVPKGAIVLEPKTGYYKDPIATLDFSALYPSIMRAYNLCYSTCVLDPKYDNLPGVVYETIDCELEIKNKDSKDDGVPVTRKIKFVQNRKGVLPEMQVEFAAARAKLKKLKKQAAAEKDDFLYMVYHAQEIATKVSSNSLYGFTGAFVLKMVEVTGSVTAKGRELIMRTKNFMENQLPNVLMEQGMVQTLPDLEVIGGDSVSGDTPLLVMDPSNGNTRFVQIQDLATDWQMYTGKKESVLPVSGYTMVWSDTGFTRIRRVIRHHVHKKMYRVRTCCGFVDVTEDHSLLSPNGEKVRPVDVTTGTPLMHTCHRDIYTTIGNLQSNIKKSHRYNDCTCDPERGYELGKLYSARPPADVVGLGDSPSSLMRFARGVPEVVLMCPDKNVMAAFLLGFFGVPHKVAMEYADKLAVAKNLLMTRSSMVPTKLAAAEILHLLGALDLNASVTGSSTKGYTLMVMPKCHRNEHVILEMTELPIPDGTWVYDLETHNHHFGVAPGTMVVHNTDSVFTCFKGFDKVHAMKCAELGAEVFTKEVVNRFPINLEFEKVQLPYLLFAKKRYCSIKYASPEDPGKLDYKGISLKRRDFCKYVKTVYHGLLDKIIEDLDSGPESCLKVLDEHLKKLSDASSTSYGTSVDINDLTISASLRKNYKNENLPHLGLRDRMQERDPGSAPRPGDRFNYVVVLDPNRSDALRECTEDPDYVLENGLKIDRFYYMNNQLKNQIMQFMETVGKGKEAEQLFDKYSDVIQQQTKGVRQERSGRQFREAHKVKDIRSFFKPKS